MFLDADAKRKETDGGKLNGLQGKRNADNGQAK